MARTLAKKTTKAPAKKSFIREHPYLTAGLGLASVWAARQAWRQRMTQPADDALADVVLRAELEDFGHAQRVQSDNILVVGQRPCTTR